ncbi:hypothetical protein [Mycobacteroides abscessus]|uniref:hypothetical protein n=1 Tax=Mycobacteroides abscessus TaxID=36809 RepID=UPI0013011EEB|nr:hypothetical protein [Mycobacteroides abscessus]
MSDGSIEAVLTNEHVSDFVREGSADEVRAEAVKWYQEAKPSFEFEAYFTALIERVEAEWRRQRGE